ncbi:insulinase family protein [Pelagibius litoralis]|uniref:Insulinase family protein n=1 Tax=Pelagibius litoralis TaxID=374515 RepID=A0A967KIE9_9PROT|nr:pitrilysin family protein [Pelagibius litoralis]NIA72211.1 insulinase family protein [Pelagibius litoralis]
MSVEVTRLPSGLTIASDAMPGTATVSLGAWVGAGTRHEAPEVNGIAHLLEHMAFKGTERRSARDIAEQIEAVGGHLNAYTSRENTAFYAKVLSQDADLALDIVADILQHPTFLEEELERERAVVLQEIGQANDTPDDIVFDYFQETAYPAQAIGRPVLGDSATVSALSSTVLRDYMQSHYGPAQMVVAAAGDVEHARFVEQVTEAFQASRFTTNGATDPAAYRGGDRREERDLEQVHLLLGFDAPGYLDDDYYGLSLLSMLFGGGMSSRLFQEVREKRGLVYSIYAFHSAFLDGGVFGIYAGTGEREVEELVPVVCDEMTKLSGAIGEDEVDRARAQVRSSLLMSRESSASRAEQLAQQLLIYGRTVPVAEVLAKIDAVTTADLQRIAAKLVTSPPTVTAIGPLAHLESAERIAARLA